MDRNPLMTHTETQAICERLREMAEYKEAEYEKWTAYVLNAAAALLTRQQEEIDRLTEAAKGSAVIVNVAKEEVERLTSKWQDAMIMEAAVTELFWTLLKLTKAKITREEFDAKLAALQAKP